MGDGRRISRACYAQAELKALRVGLLFFLCVVASAAAPDFSFTAGYGTARLDAGQTSAPFLETKDTRGSANYLRLSLRYDFASRLNVEGSYLRFSDFTTIHAVDYSRGIPFLIPNNRFRREVRAVVVGPNLTLWSTDSFSVKAGIGWVFSDLRTTLGGGQEGVRNIEHHANSGIMGSLEISYEFARQIAAGVSVRFINFGESMASSSRLTSRQGDLFVALRF